MFTRKGKIITFCLMFLLGTVLFVYGLFFHSTNISPHQQDDSTKLNKTEPALIKEVSVGGVKRDESGQIKQTYTGEAPQACPT